MKIISNAKTDTGQKRTHNEDSYEISRDQRLIAVCDGMGGHNAGEVASRTAVATLMDIFGKIQQSDVDKLTADIKINLPHKAKMLIAAVRIANLKIYNMANENVDYKGMGTTLIALYLDDNYIFSCHVGDSRIYRLRNGNLHQLTQDHTWSNLLKNNLDVKNGKPFDLDRQNVITRAVGIEPGVKIDILLDEIESNDRFLLCSDGLSRLVNDNQITQILTECETNDLAISRLIDEANAQGGRDNITAALVTVSDKKKSTEKSDKIQNTIPKVDENILLETHRIIELFAKDEYLKQKAHLIGPRRRYLYLSFAVIMLIITSVIWIRQSDKKTPAQSDATHIEKVQQVQLPVNEKLEQQIYERKLQQNEQDSFPSNNSIYTSTVKLITFREQIKDIASVYVDGKDIGKLRSLKSQIRLRPGSHIIEIRWNQQSIKSELELNHNSVFTIMIDDTLVKYYHR